MLPGSAPPQGLGERNRALLALRVALFGPAWPLRSDCPACGAECEFEVDAAALAGALEVRPGSEAGAVVDLHGRSVAIRAPTAADMRLAARERDLAGAARALMARCLPGEIEVARLDARDLELIFPADREPRSGGRDRLRARLSRLRRANWPAPIDVGAALWAELRRAAETSLTDVDALARAYGGARTR